MPMTLLYTRIMSTNGETLRGDRMVLYRELARRVCAHQPVAQIAPALDKTVSTIRRYLRDEQFQSILKTMDEEVWSNVMVELQSAAQKSIFASAEEDSAEAYETLLDIMRDTKASSSVRSRNAETVLEMAGHKDAGPEKGGTVAPMHASQINLFIDTVRQVRGIHDVAPAGGSETRTLPPDGQPD